MRTTKTTAARFKAGFTFADTAIALAIMAAVLALVTPMFLHGTSINDARAHRNAQELCSICYEAQRAGVNFVVGNEVDSTLRNLLRGGQASSGRSFKATGMTDVDAAAAAKYLRVEGGSLIVNMTSGS